MSDATRTEHDLIGDREIPITAYWGVHTLRAMENFPITGIPIGISPFLVEALAAVKEAAASANHDLGLLDDERFAAIRTACEEIREGALHDEFIVDVIQGGAGTSTNMNANEVIASRANEIATGTRGGRSPIHPNDHVNMQQSSNDSIPTAMHLAAATALRQALSPALEQLRRACPSSASSATAPITALTSSAFRSTCALATATRCVSRGERAFRCKARPRRSFSACARRRSRLTRR